MLSFSLRGMFVKHCLLCETSLLTTDYLCECCDNILPRVQNTCDICALALTGQAAICGTCLKQKPKFDQVIAVFRWEPPISQMVAGFKFNGRFEYGRLLAQFLLEKLQQNLSLKPEAIIPVPLHDNRLKERGFNQAYELALPLSKALGIRINNTICVRIKDTPRQSSLEKKQRKKNITEAFQVVGKCHYQHVVLLDDVMTTGNTVNEMSRLLKNNGVKRVDVWVVARTSKS